MGELIKDPCSEGSPEYLRQAYQRYSIAHARTQEAQRRFEQFRAEPFGTEWDYHVYQQKEVVPWEYELGAAAHQLFVCMADARGVNLLGGCFP